MILAVIIVEVFMSLIGKFAKFKLYQKIFVWVKDWYLSHRHKEAGANRPV